MPNPHNLKPFEKGNQIGKLGGRPKGSRSLSTRLREMLETKITLKDKNGVKKTQQGSDWIVESLFRNANKGNMKAVEMVFDRTEGKVPLTMNQNTTLNLGDLNLESLDTDSLKKLLEGNKDVE